MILIRRTSPTSPTCTTTLYEYLQHRSLSLSLYSHYHQLLVFVLFNSPLIFSSMLSHLGGQKLLFRFFLIISHLSQTHTASDTVSHCSSFLHCQNENLQKCRSSKTCRVKDDGKVHMCVFHIGFFYCTRGQQIEQGKCNALTVIAPFPL